MSTSTDPGRICFTSSALTRCGARAPGTSTAPITRSASVTSRSIASREDVRVWIRPCQMRSISRSRSTSLSITTTSASIPAAICAAFPPAIPPPSTTTLAGMTPEAPPIRTPRRPLEVLRSLLGRHPAGDLRHRRQQRQPAVRGLDRLVRHGADPPIHEEPGQLLIGGEVEVGEEHVIRAEAFVLLRLWLLDLDDQLSLGEHGVRVRRDLSARGYVMVVRDRRAVPGGRFHDHPVARVDELPDALGRRGHAVFVVLDLLRH